MKLEDQVCSLELAKKLKELGVTQKSLFHYWSRDNDYWSIVYGQLFNKNNPDAYSAFTVAELLSLLPGDVSIDETLYRLFIQKCEDGEYSVYYDSSHREECSFDDYSLVNALAKMLIDLIENGHVKAGDL